ncbi:MAG: DNA (cytosine-5-)-methyltransferase [bacterium]|nr:DNA (cytosine-5-)-methyltransferase [bacterium]
MSRKIYKCIDLFAGIGGIRKGYEMTGRFQNVLSAEIDKYACLTYKHLYGDDAFNDVTSEDFKQKVEDTDYEILLAGFPCQAFSIAGKQQGFQDQTRGTLFFDLADIISRTKPKAFMLENVEGLLKHSKGETFKTIIRTLDFLDYKIVGVEVKGNEVIFNSKDLVRTTKDFGIPQKRARIFIMGFRKEDIPKNYIFPKLPTHGEKIIYNNLYDLIENKVDSKFYLSERLLTTLKNHKTNHSEAKSGFGYIIVNEGKNPVSNTIMATGGSGKERNLIRQYNSEYDNILVGRNNPINKEGIRHMTPIEWGKLQGFINYAFIENGEDKFSFPHEISETQKYKMFGNSVSIPVIQEMAKYMIERLDDFYG